MKDTDLMIGDWVHVDGVQVDDDGKNPVYQLLAKRVEGLRKGVVEIDHYEFPPYLCMPIPLTPEILEKNGFVQEKASYAPILYVLYVGHPIYVKASKTVSIEFHEDYIGITICHVAGKIRKMDGSIKYVHELQHALRLCGIEKEIEL